MTTFADNYEKRCQIASKEQGIDELIIELEKHQIKAESAQTGGFTMCAYIPLTNDRYIYANSYGVSVYDIGGFEADVIQLDEGNIQKVAQAVSDYLKVDQLMNPKALKNCGVCGACGQSYYENEQASDGYHSPDFCDAYYEEESN